MIVKMQYSSQSEGTFCWQHTFQSVQIPFSSNLSAEHYSKSSPGERFSAYLENIFIKSDKSAPIVSFSANEFGWGNNFKIKVGLITLTFVPSTSSQKLGRHASCRVRPCELWVKKVWAQNIHIDFLANILENIFVNF